MRRNLVRVVPMLALVGGLTFFAGPSVTAGAANSANANSGHSLSTTAGGHGATHAGAVAFEIWCC